MKVGGGLLPRLNIRLRPISHKYREGKVKRTLKRESNRARNHDDGSPCTLHKWKPARASSHPPALGWGGGVARGGDAAGTQLCLGARCPPSRDVGASCPGVPGCKRKRGPGEVGAGSVRRDAGAVCRLSSQALLSAEAFAEPAGAAPGKVPRAGAGGFAPPLPPQGLTWSGWSRLAAVRPFPPPRGGAGGGGEPVVEAPRPAGAPPCPRRGSMPAVGGLALPSAAPPTPGRIRRMRPTVSDPLSDPGVRCHRTRLETRTKELHSAASGRGEITREGRPRAPDAQRKQVLSHNARGRQQRPQRGPLALGLVPWGPGRLSDRAYTREATTYAKPG